MISETLSDIQAHLKAPKNQYNNFGKYAYRNCEDILEALKPYLKKHKASVLLSDEINIFGDRVYVKATATFVQGEESISSTAFAREPLQKKGMDESQITGAASSYARKYALNGLFCIDDNKDADSGQNDDKVEKITEAQIKAIQAYCSEKSIDRETRIKKLSEYLGRQISSVKDMTKAEASRFIDAINK